MSEHDRYDRAHHGTWLLAREVLVGAGDVDAELVTAAQQLQHLRESGDYRALTATTEEAQAAVDLARDFVVAVERRFG